MTEPTNQARADRAFGAFSAYRNRAEEDHPETNLIDLMSDLAHLADSMGLDGFGLMNTAMIHHGSESGV